MTETDTDTETAAFPMPLTPGTWTIDPSHSGVHFKVRHLGLSSVRGRFNRFQATLVVGPDLERSRLEATVDMSSVDTNQPDRDAHLRSTDFFSADTHPEMTFRSYAIRPQRQRSFEVEGTLTINGTSRPVIISVELQGEQVSPSDGRLHAGFAGIFDVDRETFGIDFNMPMGVDGVAIGKTVQVELEAQFVAPDADALGQPAD